VTVEQTTTERFELGTDGPNVILVGLDGSQVGAEGTALDGAQTSLHAAAYASGLARRQGARLVAVWVRPRPAMADSLSDAAGTVADARAEFEDEVRRSVEAAASYYEIPTASFVIREGDPFTQLTTVADEVRADAVVVGASEHRLGSIAVKLVRDGRWPVTVVP
jgi:nucleotide-binding universal stress UspA family protein